jgi:hypothetical protein
LRRLLALTAFGAILGATGVGYATDAHADPLSGCQDDLWIVPFQSTRRVICDGAIRPDGSWLRAREFYTPAHDVPLTTRCSGGVYYSSCTTTGGYFQPRTSQGVETYIVFPDNVLPDEPPHLVNGFIA